MARLPIPGNDHNIWGTILNEYLLETHDDTGKLLAETVGNTQLQAQAVTPPKLATPTAPTAGQHLSYDGTQLTWESPVTPPTIPTDTQLIIASDAPAQWQALNGTQATGTDDHLVLQAAINTGPVLLSPGTFFLNDTIEVTNKNPQVIGSGWSTQLRIPDGTNIWAFTFTPPGDGIRGRFSSFEIDGNASNQTAGGGIHARGAVQSELHYIHFYNCYDAGLWLDAFPSSAFGHHNKVVSCLFDASLPSPGLGRGLLITSSDENYIRSEFQFLGGSSTSTYAARDMAGLNIFDGSVFIGGRNNLGGIELRDGQRSQVRGCVFDGVSGHNIFVASSSGHIITGNTLTSIGDQAEVIGQYSGIYLEYAVNECVVTNNFLETSQTVGKTRSLIREDAYGDTGVNIITQNILRQYGPGTPSEGLIEANGTGSLVSNNAVGGVIS